jgi:citrate lyase beta subunit
MISVCYYKSPKERTFQAGDRLKDTRMKCQRCLSGKEATYRVYSDALDMAVCAACAAEARKLGLTVEPLSWE